jgi:sarcosine oxidase subunit alpha
MPRLRPPRDPVTIHLDGQPVPAAKGEPVAVALVAAGHLALARSPKFHRPRGPACFRGACDGCLARVDDVPNVMTCRVPATGGLRVEVQNVVGSKDTDLLRVADWFFPGGMNHHELLAGVPGLQRVMQGFARRVAGLGRLPEQILLPRQAVRRRVDVLVVGSGPAGMATATALAARGREVVVVEDDLDWGGSARVLHAAGRTAWAAIVEPFQIAMEAGTIDVWLRTTAAGIYGDDVLVVREGAGRDPATSGETSSATVLRARTLVLAPGAHDGSLAFEGNDVPGVMSARAACRLLAHGVTPGRRPVIVRVEGGSPFGQAYVDANKAATLVDGIPLRVSGSARVRSVTVGTNGATRSLPCDALVIDAPAAPAYELCAQAGATLSHERRGFVVSVAGVVGAAGTGGQLRDRIFAAGEVAGTPLDPTALIDEARRTAQRS